MEVDDSSEYVPFEGAFASSADTDEVLPPLESATVKKLNATNAAEQKRFEKLEKQLRREKHEARARLFLQRKGFVRSSLVLKEMRRLNSGGFADQSNLADIQRREGEELDAMNKSCGEEGEDSLPHYSRPPVRLQPIHTQSTTDLKTRQSHRVEQDKLRRNVDIDSIPKCRYLRVNFGEEPPS